MKLIAGILVYGLSFYLIAYILPGVEIGGFWDVVVTAIVWGILAMFVRPIIKILTLPINIATLGLFSFVINAGLLLLTDRLVSGFSIDTFTTALLGAVLLTIISSFLNSLIKD